MHKFEVGDTVRVADKLTTVRLEGGDYLATNPQGKMDKYCGKIYTIKQATNFPIPSYTLNDVSDNAYDWVFAEEWLSLVKQAPQIIINENDIEGLFNE